MRCIELLIVAAAAELNERAMRLSVQCRYVPSLRAYWLCLCGVAFQVMDSSDLWQRNNWTWREFQARMH